MTLSTGWSAELRVDAVANARCAYRSVTKIEVLIVVIVRDELLASRYTALRVVIAYKAANIMEGTKSTPNGTPPMGEGKLGVEGMSCRTWQKISNEGTSNTTLSFILSKRYSLPRC